MSENREEIYIRMYETLKSLQKAFHSDNWPDEIAYQMHYVYKALYLAENTK